jgi:hypothetical protein
MGKERIVSFPESGLRTPREDLIERDMRIRSRDYGEGTVVALLPIGVQVWWDNPLLGTVDTHMIVHDRNWILDQERL